MKVRILGCGTSSGVPRIGGMDGAGDWGACDPLNPRNRRTRASILVSTATTRILIDTGPDLRAQLLAACIGTVDAVIWTHDHADHCHGIDDLRQLFHNLGRPVPVYARPETLASLAKRFGYAFAGKHGYPPTVEASPLPDRLTIGDIALRVTDMPHGGISCAGLRFEADGSSIGYATDVNDMTDDMRRMFEGLDVWIVDALRAQPHPSHAHLERTLGWVGELRPRHTVLTHMDQSMDYATLAATLPPGVVPGHDGLEVDLTWTNPRALG